jgi:hypothetical protein
MEGRILPNEHIRPREIVETNTDSAIDNKVLSNPVLIFEARNFRVLLKIQRLVWWTYRIAWHQEGKEKFETRER